MLFVVVVDCFQFITLSLYHFLLWSLLLTKETNILLNLLYVHQMENDTKDDFKLWYNAFTSTRVTLWG